MEDKKLDELEKFIEEISTEYLDANENKNEMVESYYNLLRKIYYCNDFRHLYSSIYSKLSNLDMLAKKNSINPMTYVNQNITLIYEYSKEKVEQDIEKPEEKEFLSKITKLYDHLRLDTSRILHMRNIDNKTEEARKDKIKTEDEIEELLLKSNKLKEDLDKQLKDSKDMQDKIEEQIEITKNLENNLKDYNKEVFGIMGVFLTIFSIIGINFDVYKAISELSLSKILLLFVGINLSLFLILNFMFGFIKDILISKNVSVTNKNSYFWYTFIGLLVIGIVIVINMRYVPETRVQKIIELEKKVKILEEKLNKQK